ncbi:Carboxylesterase family [Ceratobasidium sp. AG-Ba]|nr:Carboxylesterase family [Ceratobasidium sp. AG-Ba]QRW03235.1 Carboxylesterase family [Ceratobasidium sp. AG-Ba]
MGWPPSFILSLLLALPLLGSANASIEPSLNYNSLVRKTTSGSVLGYRDNATIPNTPIYKWLGIRYGGDTGGSNRWRPPQRVIAPPVGAVFNATQFGPACLQGRADGGNGTAIQSEDCLRINVFAPENATGLPVYIYIHGGGFDSGASSDPKIDGSFLAARGIVFASINYRLSLFGFPHAKEIEDAGQTQNLGLLDTRLAVEWMRANAAVFGGNPAKMTLGGESVGAEMTNLYMFAYHENPIVRAAIMQSGDTLQPMWPLNEQIAYIAQDLKCPTGKGLLDCLRRVPGDQLRQSLLNTKTQFQPVVDNVTVFKDAVRQTKLGKTARIPLLIGTNKDEGTLIVEGEPTAYLNATVPYVASRNLNFPLASAARLAEYYPTPSDAYPTVYNVSAGMWRDAHMLCLAHNLGKWRTESLKLPVWRYRYDLVASNLNSRGVRIGAFHGSDIRFVMGTVDTIVQSPPYVPATPEQRLISALLVTAWTNFVKDPFHGPQVSGWKRFNDSDKTSLAILGLSTNSVGSLDHTVIDKPCEY